MNKVYIDGSNMNLRDFILVARQRTQVELDDNAKTRIKRSRDLVDRFIEEERVVYGITTGFGKFSDVVISCEETVALQRNLIISHS